MGAIIATVDGVSNGDDSALRLAVEREFIQARVKAVLNVKKQRGELTSHVPIGGHRGSVKTSLRAP